ncbi:NUDIX hydrolase [Streptomyces malaysiensis]
MDVVDTWTGRTACALQAAMRLTNEGFAAHLGVGARTVAAWHSDPTIVPRADMQAVLDTAYERAGETVRQRVTLLTRPPEQRIQAQALRVAISVVVRGREVLLVCRRDGEPGWQFPAGIVKPGGSPEAVAVRETHAETGIHCAIRHHLGNRLHPVTGALCDYYLCDHLMGDAANNDPLENADVQWVPLNVLPRFIPTDRIYQPVLVALEATA